MNKKLVRGTVATEKFVDDMRKAPTVDAKKVLTTYLNWGKTPKYWSDSRAAELAESCRWALQEIAYWRGQLK